MTAEFRSTIVQAETDDGSVEVEIELIRSPDDTRELGPEYQMELARFGETLRTSGADVSQHLISLNSVGAGDYLAGTFVLALAGTVVPAVTKIVVAWIRVRAGRKVRVRIGDTYVEAKTAAEAEILLKAAAEHKQTSKLAKCGRL